ncbi:SGNH/GDSL hydrolase family protein [Leifsonia sp. H3M29-4]|uniref:SGNH/GDSL hydrolase family protein n=1 Tax=Salinibacterium metalliresistens TaxID=3031321 RepID=UPI0023DC59C8|nr:SGNH/GDSL hydrolase family protein [Salinibacterium metalliresistens]MDF1478155.1 SGNH/GDSL hydrolase family protein [Salinibacterium metalliresistens]
MANTIVFTGDSITDSGRRDPERSPLGSGYVALLAPELAAAGWQVVNTGISGNRARDVAARRHSDIDAHSPAAVSLLVGINDVWRRFDSDDPTSAEDFESAYREILGDPGIRAARWVLLEPFLIPVAPSQHEWAEDLDGKREVVCSLAAEYGAAFIPLHAEMNRDASDLGAAALTTDGVHLTPIGYERLAAHWRAYGASALA